uniref:NTF2 factor n=1 Tax=Dromaius novaehollandiae TaxID=8790 RepID=A0A8C4KQD4_DRONO
MAEKITWEQAGTSFVHLYYQHFTINRIQLSALCVSSSCWVSMSYLAKHFCHSEILQFQKIQHCKTPQDHLPASDNCILSMVVGQLKGRIIDDDSAVGFHPLFALRNTTDNWMCTSDVFRLSLYSFH